VGEKAMVLMRSDYHYQHEPILYGFTASRRAAKDDWAAAVNAGTANSQTTIFAIDRPSRSADHPTMKPSR
jgi:hypothetical protein